MDYLVWIKSMMQKMHPLSYSIPWLTFDVIRTINSTLSGGDYIFEYGAGNFTLYWAKSNMYVFSVENDKYWFEELYRIINGNEVLKIKLFFEEYKIHMLMQSISLRYLNLI